LVDKGEEAPDFALLADDGRKVYQKVKAKGHAQACLLDLKGSTETKL